MGKPMVATILSSHMEVTLLYLCIFMSLNPQSNFVKHVLYFCMLNHACMKIIMRQNIVRDKIIWAHHHSKWPCQIQKNNNLLKCEGQNGRCPMAITQGQKQTWFQLLNSVRTQLAIWNQENIKSQGKSIKYFKISLQIIFTLWKSLGVYCLQMEVHK